MAEQHSTQELVATIALSVGLLANVITVIFFTYGHQVEEHVVEGETQRLVDNLTETFAGLLPGDVKNVLVQLLEREKARFQQDPKMRDLDDQVAAHNRDIKKQAFTFSLTCLAVGASIAYFMWQRQQFSWRPFLIMNLLGALVVAAVELLFARYIAGQNKPLDINFVKWSILDGIQKAVIQ